MGERVEDVVVSELRDAGAQAVQERDAARDERDGVRRELREARVALTACQARMSEMVTERQELRARPTDVPRGAFAVAVVAAGRATWFADVASFDPEWIWACRRGTGEVVKFTRDGVYDGKRHEGARVHPAHLPALQAYLAGLA